ncbi:MAG: SPFH domain-containing protein [Lysobacterales bacterium]
MRPLTALLTAAALLTLGAVRRVPEGEACTIYRWGRYRRTLESGIHWTWPFFDRIGHRISLTGRHAQLESGVVTRADGEVVTAAGTVYFQVLDAFEAEEQIEHLEDCIRDSLRAVLREEVLPSPNVPAVDRNRALRRGVDQRLRRFGLTATRCQLDLARGVEARAA